MFSTAATAQERYSFTASLLGGFGGSLDADPDPGFGNQTFQLGFSWITQPRTSVGLRLGSVDFGDETLDRVTDADLTYLTIAGEYRTRDRFYDSGVYIGLGVYSMDALASTGSVSEEAVGLTIGVSGDFPVTPRWSVLIELAGHYAELDQTQLFVNGLVGVAYRF